VLMGASVQCARTTTHTRSLTEKGAFSAPFFPSFLRRLHSLKKTVSKCVCGARASACIYTHIYVHAHIQTHTYTHTHTHHTATRLLTLSLALGLSVSLNETVSELSVSGVGCEHVFEQCAWVRGVCIYAHTYIHPHTYTRAHIHTCTLRATTFYLPSFQVLLCLRLSLPIK